MVSVALLDADDHRVKNPKDDFDWIDGDVRRMLR